MGGIYEIRHAASGRYYVGRTANFNLRFDQHRKALDKGTHTCIYLQRAWNKYGADAFEFIEVVACDAAKAIEIESERLAVRDKLMFNMSLAATGGDTMANHPHRQQIIARRAQAQREACEAMGEEGRKVRFSKPGELNGMYGRKHKAESREAMSKTKVLTTKRGEESPNFGLKRSPETRQRLAEVASSRTGERNSFFGKTHTEETRQKIGEARRGKSPANIRGVIAEGQLYQSVSAAATALGISSALVIYRIKSTKYDYRYEEVA